MQYQLFCERQLRPVGPSTRYHVRPNYRWWICQRLGIDSDSDYEPRPFYRGLQPGETVTPLSRRLATINEEVINEEYPRGTVWRLNTSHQVVVRRRKPAKDYSPPDLGPYVPLWDSVSQVLETSAAHEVSFFLTS